MLRFPLIHPQILAALAAAGHGSTVLLADANYAHATGTNPAAVLVHLNLRPGLVTVEQVLATLVEATPFEAAALMAPDDGSPAPWAERYAAMLGAGVPVADPAVAPIVTHSGKADFVIFTRRPTRHP